MGEPEANHRHLGLFSATAAVIATMIGAGIWGTTGGFAFKLGTDTAVLLVWLFCGLLALTGALSLGELGGMMPRAGGCYIFTRHIYGSTAGYLTGVLSSLLAFVGAMGFIALLLGYYVQQFFPDVASPVSASVAVILFTAIHCSGLREGTWVNNIFTVFKIGVIIAFIVAGLKADGRTVSIQPGEATVFSTVFAAAMVSASFAYLGWETTTWIGGEVKNPQRNLPLSLIVGTVFVTILYLLINMVFLRALPAAGMVDEKGEGINGIGQHVANILFSGNISLWFNLMIIVVLISTTSTIIMVGGRILFAMSQARQPPLWAGKLNRNSVPANALLIQALATLVFIWIASSHQGADDILIFIGLPTSVIMAAAVLGVIILRSREPDCERPFRVPLYPLPPLLFIALALRGTFDWISRSSSGQSFSIKPAASPVKRVSSNGRFSPWYSHR